MAHKKKIELFINVNCEREFHYILKKHRDSLICAEIYNEFSGSCTALDHLFTRIKLDWSNGKIILLKVLADEIETFKRFREKSEPIYIFIHLNKITKLLRGVNAIKLADIARKELEYHKRVQAGEEVDRQTFGLDEATPEELEWEQELIKERENETKAYEAIRSVQHDLRKRRRAELMVPHLKNLNFVLFWPQARHAHFELYERWDLNNIIMVGREELELDEYKARDILYNGDAPINEASMYALLAAPALAICFRCLDDDVNFTSLVRKILYEYIEPLDPAKPMSDQPIQKTAFNHYKSYSLTREQIWQKRREERQKQKEEALERRARRLSEMQRLAREAIEQVLESRRLAKEQEKLRLLKIGVRSTIIVMKSAFDVCPKCSGWRDRGKINHNSYERRVRRLSEMQRLAREAIEQVLESRRLAKEQEKLRLLKIGDLDGLEKLKAEPDDEEVDIEIPQELPDDEEDLDTDIVEDENEYFPPQGLLIPGFYAPPNDIAKANGLHILFPKLVLERVEPEPEFLPPHVVAMLEIGKRYKAIAALTPRRQAVIHMGIFKATGPTDAVHIAYSVAQFDEIKEQFDEDSVMIAFMLSIKSDLALLGLMDLTPAHVSRDEHAGEVEATRLFPVYYCDPREFEDFERTGN
ncbi:uncharacterized protein LOC134797991 [Cydia splendana]|uniref:uncharacterized protein LOC134797991 n=1 Tax=Cydia splendana TaxID=1100963 RepID=UPI00300CBB64